MGIMKGVNDRMTKSTIGHGRVTVSRSSGVTGMNDISGDARDDAVSICVITYSDGKTGGVYAALLNVLPTRLNLPRKTIEKALLAGENCGWLRRRDGRVELTAAGLYMAKMTLNLPT